MYLIGVCGGSGSGKTTFAKKLQANVGEPISILHMDSYYLDTIPTNISTPSGLPNYDHPEAFDWELLFAHLLNLKNGQTINSPMYDFKTNKRSGETQQVQPTKVIIFEGIFSLFNKEIRDLLDILCFLHVDADIRFTRRLHRDVQERGRSMKSVIDQYYESVRPMHMKFLEPQKQHADFIVGEETDIAASILSAKIQDLISNDYADSREANLLRTSIKESHETTTL